MAARITPLKPGESDDSEVNDILAQMQEEWWNDSAMLGVLGANTVARPAAAEGFRVASLPTPVLFDDGMEVFRFAAPVGALAGRVGGAGASTSCRRLRRIPRGSGACRRGARSARRATP